MSEQVAAKKRAKSNATKGKPKAPAIKAKAHPELRDPKKPMFPGKVAGTGHRLTEAESKELKALRVKDPELYSLRRLAAIYGIDPASAFYVLSGGREKAKAKAKARAAKDKVKKAAAREKKAKAKPQPVASAA